MTTASKTRQPRRASATERPQLIQLVRFAEEKGIPHRTLLDLAKQKAFVSYQIGRVVYADHAALEQWLEGCRQQ